MANICEFDIVVEAKSKNDIELFKTIMNNSICTTGDSSDKRKFAGINECEIVNDLRNIRENKYFNHFYGECRHSAYSCFMSGDHTYYNDKYHKPEDGYTCIEDISKELNLDVEIFGKESGIGFIEYHHIKNGEILEDKEGYYESPIIEDYKTYEDFIKNNKGCHLTKEMFDNAKKEKMVFVDIMEFEFINCCKIDIEKYYSYNIELESCLNVARAYKEYCNYIYDHINNVQIVYDALKYFLEDYFDLDAKELYENIKNHDLSKFHPCEFNGYRTRFFPINKDEKKEAIDSNYFNKSWEHHYKYNPHHPEYWINDDGTIFEMSDVYIAEMVCDLWAMSLKFHNTPMEYINSKGNEFKEKMHESSYNKLIDVLYNIDVNHLMENLYNYKNSMIKINNYKCPKCGSNTVIREAKVISQLNSDGNDCIDYSYTCADCGYNLSYFSIDFTEEEFHKLWDSGKFESESYIDINNKLIQEVLERSDNINQK